ncbi:MAG TPA: hypothetical protein VMQ62_00200 [Dongiaceae bacterium]|nr:hypothetical protein [Dongiaceae bacterium]
MKPRKPRPAATRPVQYFTDEYLERCRAMSVAERAEFLESFRRLQASGRTRSRLISLKIPEALLQAFRRRCDLEGVRYQTQIKRLMGEWLDPDLPPLTGRGGPVS